MYKHQSTTQQINLEQESNLRHEIDKSIVSKSKEMTITKETMLDIVKLEKPRCNAYVGKLYASVGESEITVENNYPLERIQHNMK